MAAPMSKTGVMKRVAKTLNFSAFCKNCRALSYSEARVRFLNLKIGQGNAIRNSYVHNCSNKLYGTGKRDQTQSGITKILHQTCQTDRALHNSSRCRVLLGIETSCDDTGAAVIDEQGRLLGDALNSQTAVHLQTGGIIPQEAGRIHSENINNIVDEALKKAGLVIEDIDVVATTIKPGLSASLGVGLQYTKTLLNEIRTPFIPIHHMEAHALTVRMIHDVKFPYLVLLASGGHCLLSIVRGVDDFLLLGTCIDTSPGDALDKLARKLNLKSIPEFQSCSGGAAIEQLAKSGNPEAFLPSLSIPMDHKSTCDFSFSGLRTQAETLVDEYVKETDFSHGNVPEVVHNLCASYQYAVLSHLARRVHRALKFCEIKGYLPANKTEKFKLVISGGVGSNQSIRQGLARVASLFDCEVLAPPPHLCTDNGIMIAWNGIEKLRASTGIIPYSSEYVQSLRYEPRSPLGVDIRKEVQNSSIKLPAPIPLL